MYENCTRNEWQNQGLSHPFGGPVQHLKRKHPVFSFPFGWNKLRQQWKVQVQTQNPVVVLFGEVGVEVLDVSNANTVLQLSSERDKHHCSVEFNFDSPSKEQKNKWKWYHVTPRESKLKMSRGRIDTGARHLQHQIKLACVVGAQHLQKSGPLASFPLIRSTGALPNSKTLG